MSKFDLRDISQRLAASRDTEAVVFEFLGYLQAVRGGLARDAGLLRGQPRRSGQRLRRGRERGSRAATSVIPVDQLPRPTRAEVLPPQCIFQRQPTAARCSPTCSSPRRSTSPTPPRRPPLLPLMPGLGLAVVRVHAARRPGRPARRPDADERQEGRLRQPHGRRDHPAQEHGRRWRSPSTSTAPARGPRATARTRRRATAAAEFQDRIRRLNVETAELTEDNRAKSRQARSRWRTELERLDRNSSRLQAGAGAGEEPAARARGAVGHGDPAPDRGAYSQLERRAGPGSARCCAR